MNAGCRSGERPIEGLTNYIFLVPLFEDLSYDCGADGETTLANSEPHPLVQSNRMNQLTNQLTIISRHNHMILIHLLSNVNETVISHVLAYN